MSQFEFSFNQLNDVDLIVDAVYKGGDKGNVGDDPLSKLLGCGNQRGFRYLGSPPNYKMVVLYSSLKNADWPNFIDMESGIFTYYGDNKTSGHTLSEPRGNKLPEFAFDILHNSPMDRCDIPPFFVFTQANQGRDVVFRGLAAPGVQGVPSTEDLVAI